MGGLDLSDPDARVLGRILLRQAQRIPDSPYILSGEEQFSYGRVNDLANSYAAGLHGLGVRAGDTVAFLMRSCKEFVFATFGAMKLGAIWIPTHADYRGEWLRRSLADSRANLLVADADLLPRVAEAAEGLPLEHVVARGAGEVPDLGAEVTRLADFERLVPKEPEGVNLDYSDTAAVLWTSGTTGRAKGVMQSHNVWVRGALSGARNSGTRSDDVMYCCLPMYNSAAWVANIYRALVTGLPCGLDEGFSATQFWDRCRHYGATQVFTLGAMHMFLWNAEPRPDDADNPVRHASMVPIPDELIEPLKSRFGIETIDQGYGQSEVMGILHRSAHEGRTWKPRALGEPVPGVEFRLLDDDDREVSPGEVGEFCVRPTEPYTIFSGYFNDPTATLAAFRNLWYHTGGVRSRDQDRSRSEARCRARARRARPLRQRKRSVLLRAALHRVRRGAAAHADGKSAEVQAARARRDGRDLGSRGGWLRDRALRALRLRPVTCGTSG